MITSSCLLGTVTAEDEQDRTSIEDLVKSLIPFCESHGWDEKSRWVFRADFALPEYAKLQEGELHDMMRAIYPTLLDLYHFHEASFEMMIFLGETMGKAFTLQPHILSMCASLGMSIDLFIEQSKPEPPPSHGT